MGSHSSSAPRAGVIEYTRRVPPLELEPNRLNALDARSDTYRFFPAFFFPADFLAAGLAALRAGLLPFFGAALRAGRRDADFAALFLTDFFTALGAFDFEAAAFFGAAFATGAAAGGGAA